MAATYPMSITGSNLSFESVTVDTQLGTPQPIKPISKILVSLQTDKTRRLTVGDEDPISSYRVRARDEDDVDYYGFVKSSGDWRVVDKRARNASPTSSRSRPTLSPTNKSWWVKRPAPPT